MLSSISLFAITFPLDTGRKRHSDVQTFKLRPVVTGLLDGTFLSDITA